MKLEELQRLIDSKDDLGYQMDDKGILIRSARFETLTHATFEAVEANTSGTILTACAQGRDVDHITRVTGYFSRVSSFNRGKAAELKDRYRASI